MARRNRQLIRVLRLVKHLDGVRYIQSLNTLAALLNVHVRTIRRDLEALEAAGWKVPHWRHLVKGKQEAA